MVTITVPSRTGGSINVDLPSRDGGGTIDINLATRGDRPTSTAYELRDLSNVATVNTYLLAVATAGGREVVVYPNANGAHNPNFLESGIEISVPAGVTLRAVGEVTINSDNPTRGVFRLAGDGARIIGPFRLIRVAPRVDGGAAAGTYNAWGTAWNAAYPAYQIPSGEWATKSWRNAWNDNITHSLIGNFGAMNGEGRGSAIWSYDADDLVIDGIFADNFAAIINLQGRNIIGTSYADTYSMQTSGNVVKNIKGDNFDFMVLAKKQRNFLVDNIVSEYIGYRILDKPPHIVYLSGEPTKYEQNWNVHLGNVKAYNYMSSSMVKAKQVRNLTWDNIVGYTCHSAIQMGNCTGVGGNVTIYDHSRETDPNGGSFATAVDLNESPGFVIGGTIEVYQRAGQNGIKALVLDRSNGVQCLGGVKIVCDRTSASGSSILLRESTGCQIGLIEYEDLAAEGAPIISLSDLEEEGGDASSNTFHFGTVTGTAKLATLNGSSSDNKFFVDPSLIDEWDADAALDNTGFGTGNLLIDYVTGTKPPLEVSASTDLTTKARATLTIQRTAEGDDEAVTAPYLFAHNDTITFGGRTYTWKTALSTGPTVANEILIPNAAIVARYPLMTAEYGYLQLAFLDAAVRGTNYKTAGAPGVDPVATPGIYSTGTAAHATVESQWGGARLNLRALTGGTGPNDYTTTVSMTGGYATWENGATTGTFARGGSVDLSLVNRTILVTSGASDLTMTLPTSAPEGTWAEFVKVDTGTGTVDCGGYALLTLKNQRAKISYEGGEWRASLSAPATIYFSASGTGTGLSSASPTTFALAYAMYGQYASRVKQAYRLEEVSSGTYTFASSPISMTNIHAGSPLTIEFDAATIVQGVNAAGTRTSEFARVSMGAELIVYQNECLLRTFGAAIRTSYGGRVTLHDSKIKDCVRGVSIGYGGRFVCESIVDWDGRDLSNAAIADSNALLAVIGSTYSCDQGSFGSGAIVHDWDRGFVLSEGSSGHMDYVWFDDCDIGLEMARGAGQPNATPFRCTNCNIAVKSDNNPPLISTTEATWIEQFGIGTADECNETIRLVAGGTTSGIEDSAFDSRPMFSGNQLDLEATVTGNTTENDTWKPLVVLPKGARDRDWIRVKHHVTFSLDNADCVYRVYAAGLLGYVTIPRYTIWADIYIDINWQDSNTDVGGSIRADCCSSNTDGLITVIGTRISLATGTAAFPIAGTPASTQLRTTMQLANSSDNYRQIAGEVTHTIAGARYAL